MGFGLPAAMGEQLAFPDDPVVVVSGDGSIMMNIQELATLKRYELPVKIVVIDNSGLGMVRQWQELFFDQRFSEIDLSDNPEFSTVAESFGLEAMVISAASEIPAGIEFLKRSHGPCLLHVRIDPQHNVWPLVPPGQSNKPHAGESLMKIQLNVSLNPVEGALLRLLGTIERRGHRLLDLNSLENGSLEQLRLGVDCDDRAPDLLLRQIQRLQEVHTASFVPAEEIETTAVDQARETLTRSNWPGTTGMGVGTWLIT